MASETQTTTQTDGESRANYLDREINILRPATPFMRDHLRLIWVAFAGWALAVFGPVTATALAPDVMTGTFVLGFQLHYFLTAVGAPLGALLLSIAYAWRRDRLDQKYDISHQTAEEEPSDAAVADGGFEE